MDIFETQDLTFSYPQVQVAALEKISVSIPQGSFVLLCGPSGGGKTTFLKLLKPELTPHGVRTGKVIYAHEEIDGLDQKRSASEIGFVMQDPESQIVTDEVWHELAFGLENLGMPSEEIRLRVGEMAHYFGISSWYHQKTATLSGGQKQMLNLASVMVMGPKVLLLDEPTAQLDPIAAEQFIGTLSKLNKDFGITIILSEHRLEEIFHFVDYVMVLEEGRCVEFDSPRNVCKMLSGKPVFAGFPAAARTYAALGKDDSNYPVSVREGRQWLSEEIDKQRLIPSDRAADSRTLSEEFALELKNVWFRYERFSQDIMSGTDARIRKGTVTAILGGNGAGKTTALLVMAGLLKPYRGQVKWFGTPIDKYRSGDKHRRFVSMLPQNPSLVFVKDTVMDDFKLMLNDTGNGKDKDQQIRQISEEFGLEESILSRNPADLSGGELQKCALAKICLGNPKILLVDEPTKGLDAFFKRQLKELLIKKAKEDGLTVIMVTHDVEFAAEAADQCMLAFDGELLAPGTPETFFTRNRFYTTAAARLAADLVPESVTVEQIVGRLKRAGGLADG